MSDPPRNLALPLSGCVTLACLWEATASKPGNVTRGADFDDLTFADFQASSVAIGPAIAAAGTIGVGPAILRAVEASRAVCASNAHLGTILLLAPLAAIPTGAVCAEGIGQVLDHLTVADAVAAYDAIRFAQPGGLGRVAQADVQSDAPPTVTLREAMRLAANRDRIAAQYACGFADVLSLADRLAAAAANLPLGEAIVDAFVDELAAHPDSLIARKNGPAVADEASRRAARAAAARRHGRGNYDEALADFDFWLRSDGRRRNPGTTADLIAAALFVLLREGRLYGPVRFYAEDDDPGERDRSD